MLTVLIEHTANGELQYFSGYQEIEQTENGIAVGDTVTWHKFTDSSGKHHDAVHGLIVEKIERHASKYGAHERIRAVGGGFRYVEGNAKFFEKSAPRVPYPAAFTERAWVTA